MKILGLEQETTRWHWGSTALSIVVTAGLAIVIGSLEIANLWPFGIAAIVTASLGVLAVPALQHLKTGQVIREDGPQSHLSKGGTPTMGGLYFIPVGVLAGLVWTQAAPMAIAVGTISLAFGFIGWLDDWQVIRAHSNKGIAPKLKLGLQIAVAIAACISFAQMGWLDTAIPLPGLGSLTLGFGFWPLALFVFTGTNNAVNLTDGLDGLAAGTVAIALVALGCLVGDPALSTMSFALAGSCLGFLAHNRNPAQVFMGDTGSLALGGALATIALLGNCLWALAIAGLVFVAEAVSVILQVSYFKYTKRRTGTGQRLLRMSPLHHHLELGGWSEVTVVTVLYAAGAVLGTGAWLLQFM